MQPRTAAPLSIAWLLATLAVAPHARAQSADAASAADAAAPPVDDAGAPAAVGDAGAPSQPTNRPLVALVDAAPIGVDARAGTFVTDTLRDELAQLGYDTVPVPVLYEAARGMHLRFPAPPDDLHALVDGLHAAIGVTAEVGAANNYYQVTLRVRFTGELVERTRVILATQWTLADTIRGTLATLLAPAGVANSGLTFDNGAGMPILPDMTSYVPPPPARPFRIHGRGELALGLGPSFGPFGDPFVNFFTYVRGALFPLDRLGIDLSVGYGNLRGRTDRVSNVLIMTGIETAVEIARPPHRDGNTGVYFPLRAEFGYLPLNGPVVRGTAAVAWSYSPGLRMEIDVLSLGGWGLPGSAAFTLDVGVQIMWDFGVQIPRRRRRRHPASDATAATPTMASVAPSQPDAASPPRTAPVGSD